MEKKKTAIIGIGGRTGTMFAFELQNSAKILGIGREKEIKMIKEKKLFVERKERTPELFEEKVIKDTEFNENIQPDIIFFTTKNPIGPVVRHYYQKFTPHQKIGGGPTLLISQNGIDAIGDSQEVLKEIFGEESEKTRAIRIILFNPIDKKEEGDKVIIKYSLPIRIAIAKFSGIGGIEDIVKIFRDSNFELTVFPEKEARNLEFSKLFLNLIGMAAASRGFSIAEGFKDREIFKEERMALREYIKVVKASGGKILNFPHYPVKFLTLLINWIPFKILLLFRNVLASLISEGRGGKPKDLDEIDYYNGGVAKLGKKFGIETQINENIYKKTLEKLAK